MPTIVDHFGSEWSVTQVRDTEHLFPVCLGFPPGASPGRDGCSVNPTVILTRELAGYLTANRHARYQSLRLPIGRAVIRRLRSELGFDRYADRREWWESRLEDLSALTIEEFAVKHGSSAASVEWWRLELIGKVNRDNGWWRAEPIRSVLLSDKSAKDVAQELQIQETDVGRLRSLLKDEGFKVPIDYRERISRAKKGKPAHPKTREILLDHAKRPKPESHRRAIGEALRRSRREVRDDK